MAKTICGLDCSECANGNTCGGCSEISDKCVVAMCCRKEGHESCGECSPVCEFKERLIAEFNSLGIEDMEEVTQLNNLRGDFINLKYTLPSGQTVKFLDDNKVYLGNQICKKGSDRCYGLAADESFLLVCEYGYQGSDAEIVVYKKRVW